MADKKKTNAEPQSFITAPQLAAPNSGHRSARPTRGAKRGRKPANLPTFVDAEGVRLTRYESEKRLGIRRSNGARVLRSLSRRHLEIITRHLEGESGEHISLAMDITVITVSRILNDPLAKHFVEQIFKDRKKEIDALAGKAIDSVREGFDDKDKTFRERMLAVDKYVKLKDTLASEDSDRETAEDVVQRIMQSVHIKDSNVQIVAGDKK